jgi:RNA polymerase sigma-70 factor (ECF subfamily)
MKPNRISLTTASVPVAPAAHEGPADAAAISPAKDAPARTPSIDAIRRAQAGDRAALEAVLAAARPRVVAVALRMVRDADEAEDVVQEALTKVWRNLARYEARSAFSTWLHRIVVNTALDHLRARRGGVVLSGPQRHRSEDAAELEAARAERVERTTPEDRLAEAELGQAVRSAMDGLSAAHRQVLAWRELEGESYQDIARLARCPVGTVMSRLHHARQRLAETLHLDAGLEAWVPAAA